MKARLSARQKLQRDHGLPQVKEIPPQMAGKWGKGRMLIPRPLDVDALVRKIGKGKLTTISRLRERLAKDFKADVTCPLTTGIFLRLSAEAAEEERAEGKKNIAPYWRVIRDDGRLNDKFPGGVSHQAALLQAEGFQIEQGRGAKNLKVKNFERYLVSP